MVPKYLRKEAREKIPEAVEKAIEEYILNGDYCGLDKISKDERLPEYLRNEAKERMSLELRIKHKLQNLF